MYQDRTLVCADCGEDFIFTAGEQEFHESKGFSNEPRRCKSCRAVRKGRGGGGGGGGGGRGGPGRGGSGRDMPPRQMYDAVCAECGRDTQVPFQPTGARPVYCSDCFSSRGGGGGGGGGSRGGHGGGGGRGGPRRDRY